VVIAAKVEAEISFEALKASKEISAGSRLACSYLFTLGRDLDTAT
jgi:hypothetical protein